MPHLNPSSTQAIDDEIIPTAIVIKNIPFNVKRETLLDIIVRIFLPLISLILHHSARLLYQSPRLMPSIITLTNRVHFVD